MVLKDVNITGVVAGDHFKIWVDIPVPEGEVIAKAWLGIKTRTTDPDPGLVLKAVTTADVTGTGQVVDTGATDGQGLCRFDLVPDDTEKLEQRAYYGVKIKTDLGNLYTAVKGHIQAEEGIVDAES